MLTLTRIFLHNWHRFTHHTIEVEDSLYLAGHNGSGKSSVLDALQVVLIANQQQMRLNSAAQEGSKRTIETYVHGAIGEERLLRPGPTIAYIALEFRDRNTNAPVTLAVCIEAADGKADRLYAILPAPLDAQFFVPRGEPRTRKDLRTEMQSHAIGRYYSAINEYQTDMRARLGGLNERFFDLFLRALTFQPLTNITDFVEKWLLRAKPLQLETLQRIVEDYQHLQARAIEVRMRLAALETIEGHRAEARRFQTLHSQYLVLAALLALRLAEQQLADVTSQLAQGKSHFNAAECELAEARATGEVASAEYRRVQEQLLRSEVRQRRDSLGHAINDAQVQADAIKGRWLDLVQSIQEEGAHVQSLVAEPEAFDDRERGSLTQFNECARALASNAAPPDGLDKLVSQAIQVLHGAIGKVRDERAKLDAETSRLEERVKELNHILERLRRDGHAFPTHVERIREQVADLLGVRPKLLCELLEIPDESWQDAVEAVLDQRRFALVVPPVELLRVVQLLDTLRSDKELFDTHVLDLVGILDKAGTPLPESLASRISTEDPDLRSFISAILGNIVTCPQVDGLLEYEHAVTPDVMIKSNGTVHAASPERYRPWYVGMRAARSQIEAYERERTMLSSGLQHGSLRRSLLNERQGRLDRVPALERIRGRLTEPLDDRELRGRIASLRWELAQLDIASVELLEAEAQRLRHAEDLAAKRAEAALVQQTRAEMDLKHLEALCKEKLTNQAQRRDEVVQIYGSYPDVVFGAEADLQDRAAQSDVAELIRNTQRAAKGFETQRDNARTEFYAAAKVYNTTFHFAGRPDVPEDDRYARELARLRDTDLAEHERAIDAAQREASVELDHHVLQELRGNIEMVDYEFRQINAALGKLDFRGERYRFTHKPAEELEEFYQLIKNFQSAAPGSLLGGSHKNSGESVDRFREELTRRPETESERSRQARLTDYRRYLTYDIIVTRADGQESRLSKLMGLTSGGEAQTPFYVTIAASFLQLYNPTGLHGKSTIRLVAFDEAFSKMDQDRIGTTLELFQRFNLQIIAATPLERCEYLVPKMRTNLVLTTVGDNVLVEPYLNYVATSDVSDGN